MRLLTIPIRPTSACRMPLLALVLLSTSPAGSAASPAPRPTSNDASAFFLREVRPILERNCLTCHSGEKANGGLQLTSREAILKGGASGPAVSLQRPSESLLVAAINHRGRQMPPRGKLPKREIDALARWVTMGLPWAAGSTGTPALGAHAGPPKVTPEAMRFWSFRPVRRPPIPVAVSPRPASGGYPGRLAVSPSPHPIDAFIRTRLAAEGLVPNPPADRVALLRRATYDLTGLPPTPEEVRAFLADRSPKAWETVVDRLLASPRYGEKWGRHWLDLVRYAETNSYERDGTKPNAWRYRDYVIQSFNSDKPYNQFLIEQLAGDELSPRTPERLIATGFYRLGIWDDEPVDVDQALYDDLDDIVTTTGQVFLGLTVNCARCHDHKVEPIPQRDYYRLLSFFSGYQRYGGPGRGGDAKHSLRSIATKEEEERYRGEAVAHEAALKAAQEPIDRVEKRVREVLTPVEKEEFRHEQNRTGIVKLRVPSLVSEAEFAEYQKQLEARQKLRENPPRAVAMALCVTEVGREPRETHVLARGNPHVPGEKVEPGFPSVLSPPPPATPVSSHGDTSGRRLALANWIASPRNPLTVRVIVNRVWQHHFGRGIVRSASNFGFQGDRPTHPELLDWLASEFVARGWRLKALHRLIMLSGAYRMSSRANPRALAKDPENDLFWRFDMRRLTAEEVRDSILAVNGSLNVQMGGPSIYPVIPDEVLAGQSVPGSGWGKSTEEEQRRRSVYIFVKRSLITPILASFDGAETDMTCPVRFTTTQPTQALGMLNSAFLNAEAKRFGEDVRRSAGDRPADRIGLALRRVFQREPTRAEIDRGVRLIADLQRVEKQSADDALATFCLVALNLNEFLYLD